MNIFTNPSAFSRCTNTMKNILKTSKLVQISAKLKTQNLKTLKTKNSKKCSPRTQMSKELKTHKVSNVINRPERPTVQKSHFRYLAKNLKTFILTIYKIRLLHDKYSSFPTLTFHQRYNYQPLSLTFTREVATNVIKPEETQDPQNEEAPLS